MRETTSEEFDERALEEVAREGARAPEWLVKGEEPPPGEESEAALAAIQDLRQEIGPETRARIVERAVDAFLGGAPANAAPAQARVVQISPRRRWLWALPLLAAAAAVTLLLLPGEAPVPDPVERLAVIGETHLRPGIRGEVPAGELRLAADSDFYLECAPDLRDVSVTSVRAVRGDEVRTLESQVTSADGATTELFVHAALTPGRWAVQCGVTTRDGRFAWLDPPAPLLIE